MDTQAQMQALEEVFEALKKKGGVPHGKIWWMERQMTEVKKFVRGGKQLKKVRV